MIKMSAVMIWDNSKINMINLSAMMIWDIYSKIDMIKMSAMMIWDNSKIDMINLSAIDVTNICIFEFSYTFFRLLAQNQAPYG